MVRIPSYRIHSNDSSIRRASSQPTGVANDWIGYSLLRSYPCILYIITTWTFINHSFYHYLSSQTYGKEHPEYFALVEGKRKLDMGGGGPELCLTHPDVLQIVVTKILDALKEHPGMENISVSQNDNNKYCRCSQCAAIDTREGTPTGSLLTFVMVSPMPVNKVPLRPRVNDSHASLGCKRQTNENEAILVKPCSCCTVSVCDSFFRHSRLETVVILAHQRGLTRPDILKASQGE